MGSTIDVVQAADGTWHRTDILGCDYASVIRDPRAETRVSSTDLDGLEERCPKCTW